jgi:hypothetical protein
VQDVARRAADAVGVAARLPGRLDHLVGRLEDGTLEVGSPRIERQLGRIERTARRVLAAVLFGGLLIAGAVLRADDDGLGTVLMVASAVPLLYALLAGRLPG